MVALREFFVSIRRKSKSNLFTYAATGAAEHDRVVDSLNVVEVLCVLRRSALGVEVRLPASREGTNLFTGSKGIIASRQTIVLPCSNIHTESMSRGASGTWLIRK